MKCLFTKETNRRMSSIKYVSTAPYHNASYGILAKPYRQVQDLERQLMQAKQQLSRLQSEVDDASQTNDGMQTSSGRAKAWPQSNLHPQEEVVRAQSLTYGQGIHTIPSTPSQLLSQRASLPPSLPSLPPPSVADHLLQLYHSHLHIPLPIIHWPSFMAEYEEVERAGSLSRAPRSWAALLFSVFACASLYTNDRELTARGSDYLRTSIGLHDMFEDKADIYVVRMSLLTSMFLYEMNMKSASWMWISYAINMAHDIKLNTEDPSCGAVEAETRRRAWWGLYTRERYANYLLLGDVFAAIDQYHAD